MIFRYLVFASALLWLGQAEEVDYRCPHGHLYGTKCFIEKNDDKTFDQADLSCNVMGGFLLRQKHVEISNFLKGKLNGLYVYWVGVKAYDSSRNWEFVDRTPVTNYHPWKFGEPNNFFGVEYCVHASGGNLNWNDANCANKYSYICEVPATKVCPPGWELSPTDQVCIKAFSQVDLSWEEGRLFCQNLGGDLLKIDNKGTHDVAKDMLAEGSKYWVGIRDVCKDRKFLYMDMESLGNFQAWAKGEPNNYRNNEFCVGINGPGVGSWNDRACGKKSGVLCQLE